MKPVDVRIRAVALVLGLALGSELVAKGRLETVTPAADGETLDAAIRRNISAVLLERRGARVIDPAHDVLWLSAPEGELSFWQTTTRQTFVALAVPPRHTDEPLPPGASTNARDLFRLEARVTPYGVVYDDAWIVNLTNTADADEHSMAARGLEVALAVSYADRVLALEVRNLAGEDAHRAGTDTWSLLRRIGDGITNLEQTGSRHGLELQRYTIASESPPAEVALRFATGAALEATTLTGAPLATIDLTAHSAAGPLELAYNPPEEKMQYDFLNWLADRGRGLADQGLMPEWSGTGVELMKEVYFKAEEVKAQVAEAVVEPSVAEVEKEAPEIVQKAIETAKFEARGNDRPWPPPPIEPMTGERVKGEGIWEAVPSDEVTYAPNAPPTFYRTFIRPDPELPSKRIYLVVWNPELVGLKMRAGTTNPVPTTGNRGDGRIPRSPETMKRIVGGFNGGFQTAHVWYGMMVDRKVLLPPREWGATAGSWEDGRTVFATWPPKGDIPPGLTHYRQNLPPLVEDGVFNPYGRNTWGWHKDVAGAVDGKTIRSGLCYTTLDYVMYAYVEFANEGLMSRSLIAAGCKYAIHLDMNRGHTGFEMYKTLATGESPKGEDPTVTVEGVRFEGHTLHPTNKHMKAPTRYLGVDYRDYFYLELRDTLPGADLAVGDATAPWATEGLPENTAFPPRFARSSLPAAGVTEVYAIDTRGAALSEAPTGKLALGIALGPDSTGSTVRLASDAAPGAPLDGLPVPAEGTLTGLIVARDAATFVYVVSVTGARAGDVATWLTSRHVVESVYRPNPSPPAMRWYQKTADGRLIEAPIGKADGLVVSAPTLTGRALYAAVVDRPSAIVRLFPETKPTSNQRR